MAVNSKRFALTSGALFFFICEEGMGGEAACSHRPCNVFC